MIQVLLAFPKELLLIFAARTLEVGLVIAYPSLVEAAITFLNNSSASVNIGYGLVGAFFCVSMGIAVSQTKSQLFPSLRHDLPRWYLPTDRSNAKLVSPWCYHMLFRFMTITRGALVAMLYSKLLRTRSGALDQSIALTLVTTDAEKIVETFWRLILDPWSCLLQLGILVYLLYRQVGAVCCAPIIVMLRKMFLPCMQYSAGNLN